MYDLVKGMKILDLTRLTPGGYTTKLLSELGAEVVKVEDIENGDYMRIVGPMFDENSVWFHAVNVNKKSVCLNLKTKDGVSLFKRIMKGFDVLIESFRPGVMARLGLDYGALSAENPRLIYCSLTGYGQNGPFCKQPGHDVNYMSIAGALGLNGEKDGPVVPMGMQAADLGGATMAAVGILAAYACAQRTGNGRYIDVAMTDTVLSWLPLELTEAMATGAAPERGAWHLNGGEACYAVYATKDGRHVAMGNREEKFWNRFCETAKRPDLKDLQFSRDKAAFDRIGAFFKSMTLKEVVEAFDGADTCLTPVLKLDEVPDHPQVAAREMIAGKRKETGHPPFLACPIRFNGERKMNYMRAPKLGEHTREILENIGCTWEEIERFAAKGILGKS